MKKNYIVLTCLSALLCWGCQDNDTIAPPQGEGELSFAATVKERVTDKIEGKTRALDKDFFTKGNPIAVKITTNKEAEKVYRYIYDGSYFVGENKSTTFHFNLDDSYITRLYAEWPVTRAAITSSTFRDQRNEANYKAADWMRALISTDVLNVLPTATPVPIEFERENVLLDFEIVGQNATGLNIDSLVVELYDSNDGSVGGEKPKSYAYRAYCGNPNGHAELIIDEGMKFITPENYKVGAVWVKGQSNYFSIIFKKQDYEFKAGHRHLITLVPQGDDIMAVVSISGFWQEPGGVAFPFQPPTQDNPANPDENYFIINQPVQLLSLSYLTRHYNLGGEKGYTWTEGIYTFADDFEMTESFANQYIPIDKTTFYGKFIYKGAEITSLSYGNGKTLQLLK